MVESYQHEIPVVSAVVLWVVFQVFQHVSVASSIHVCVYYEHGFQQRFKSIFQFREASILCIESVPCTANTLLVGEVA